MDQRTLDAIARRAATGSSRRQVVGTVVALLAGGRFGLRPEPAAASCKKVNQNCDKNKDCCDHAHCPNKKCRCKSGFRNCSGTCVFLDRDENNCGACGTACLGRCQVFPGQPTVCFPACCRGGECVDTRSDRDNCGACGNACEVGRTCCQGECVDTRSDERNCGLCGNACDPGLNCCGTIGACVDLQTSEANCGTCGNSCGENQRCEKGVCRDLA